MRLTEALVDKRSGEDPITRQEYAQLYINGEVARMTNLRAMEKIKATTAPPGAWVTRTAARPAR